MDCFGHSYYSPKDIAYPSVGLEGLIGDIDFVLPPCPHSCYAVFQYVVAVRLLAREGENDNVC